MEIGKFGHLVTIQQKTTSLNAYREEVASWATLATVWAQVQPLRGREFFAAQETQATADVRFRIRYRSDVTALMRLVWRGVNYDIVGHPSDVEGEKSVLEIMGVTGVRDGR